MAYLVLDVPPQGAPPQGVLPQGVLPQGVPSHDKFRSSSTQLEPA